jgi:uncharacterized membrane protein
MRRFTSIALLAGCTLDSATEVESRALTPPLVITPRATAIGEAGDNAFIKIRMTERPHGPLTLDLSSSHPGEARLVPSSVTFTPNSWEATVTVEIVPIDDAVFDGDIPIEIEARVDRGAYGGYSAHVDVLSVDDDYTITGYRATKFVGDAEMIPVAINNRSQIALDIRMPDNSLHPFLWDAGALTDLNPTGVDFNRATGMNDNGAVIGSTSAFGSGSFVYQDGVLRPGWASTNAINELDHEVGSEFLCIEGICNPLVTEEMGFFPTGLAINNRDHVTGRYPAGGGREAAFYWVPGPVVGPGVFTDLGGSPRGEGLGINEHGDAVGRRFDASFNYQPFLYANGTITELGTATGSVGGTAVAINNRGDIAGSDYDEGRLPVAGWIGRPGSLTSLQSLVVDGSCFLMLEVIDMNDRGEIIARGWECNVGTPYAFLFEPIKAARP